MVGAGWADFLGDGILVIHHWDADGVASAAIIMRELGRRRVTRLYTPPIGTYRLPREEVSRAAAGADSAVVLDLALPWSDVEWLAREVGRVVVVDHHVRREPIGALDGVLPGIDPLALSTSWLLTSLLEREADGLSVLGVAGDLGWRMEYHPEAREFSEAAARSGFDSMGDVIRLAELVDSNYRVGDREGVLEAAEILASARDLSHLLERREWVERLERAEEEVERVRREMLYRREGRLIYAEFESPHNLISRIGRELAWGDEGVVAVVLNRSWRDGLAQLYVRVNGLEVDLDGIWAEASSRGYSVGGKADVIGVVLPEGEARDFLELTIGNVRGQLAPWGLGGGEGDARDLGDSTRGG